MAQIVTITNPLTGQPAQVDQLEHTAQEIDDAIARAKAGGAIDTALQNKMGGIESTDYPGCYYRMVSGVVEWINPPMQLGGMDADGNPINEYRTTERYLGKPVYVKRIILDALAIGTEAQPARTNIDGVLFTGVCETLVRHDMFVYPSAGGPMFRIPFIDVPGKVKAIGSMNQSNVAAGNTWLYGSIYTFDDLSAYKAMVTCWYTKTTD